MLRRRFALECATLSWNVIDIVVLASTARSVALAGFGLDSLIEIGASAVVTWELSGTGETRQRRTLRLIGAAFAALAVECPGGPGWPIRAFFLGISDRSRRAAAGSSRSRRARRLAHPRRR